MSHEYYPELGLYLSRPPSGELMPAGASDAFFTSDWETSEGYYNFYGAYYTQYGTLFDPERMAKNPWIGAALFRRSIRRLWHRAAGLYDDDGEELYPAQLTHPKDVPDEQWEFSAWNFDERLDRPFAQVIEAAQMAKIKHGFGIAEIMWATEETPFGRRIVITDLRDRDPRRFLLNPRDYPLGIYRRSDMTLLQAENDRQKKFVVWTAKEKYELKRGQSEFELLIDPEYALPKIEKYERRHLERNGSPLLVLETSKMAGSSAKENWRQTQAETIRKQGNQAVIVITKDSESLTAVENKGEVEGFEKAITREIKKIGSVLLSNPTALIDGPRGSYGKEESTGARALQAHEQTDAEDIENGINYQLIPYLLDYNWAGITIYPEIKIIPPETETPTTPKDQQTIYEIKGEENEERDTEDKQRTSKKEQGEEPEMMAAKMLTWNRGDIQEILALQKQILEKFQRSPYYQVTYPQTPQTSITLPVTNFQEEEEQQEEEPQIPPAIPPGYIDFPSDAPLSPEYRSSVTLATQYLESMPAKPYKKVQKNEAHGVFTVKRLRAFGGDAELVAALKNAIVPTLQAESEKAAWEQYWPAAYQIFREYGFEQPSPELRNDLKISFRQARQNALNEGFYQNAKADPNVVGLQLVPDPNVKQRHLDEIAWDNLVIPIGHKELQIGGRLRIPLNFGCMHTYHKIYDAELITPESEWPSEFPGRTYRYYAQPEETAK